MNAMIMNAINTKRIGDYLIEIFPDDSPESPREWDNLGTMVCFHNRYRLGDKHEYDYREFDGWDSMEKHIRRNENVGAILPLYLYDHSGITMRTYDFNDRWDSGRVGFIFVSKKKILEEFGGKIVTKKLVERAEKSLIAEVETYDQYLRGNIYGYRVSKVETCNLGHEHTEEIDSCWGYYGQDICIKEAEWIVENL